MKKNSLFPIPAEKLSEMIGRPIQLRGCAYGYIWILKEIIGDQMVLEAPKTKRLSRSHVGNACYTKHWAQRQ